MSGVPGLKLGAFEYTTVAALRRQGVAKVDASDARLRELIRDKSQIVNDMTEQWFAPVEGTTFLTGRTSPILVLGNAIPILGVDSLRLLDRGYEESTAAGVLLGSEEYVVHERYIELVDVVFKRSGFSIDTGSDMMPSGSTRITRGIGHQFQPVPQGVKVEGAFGWLEEVKPARFQSTLAAGVAAGAKQATLAVVTGLEVRDVLLLGTGESSQRAIVESIDPSTKIVTFPAVEYAVASGATVRAYGKVPRQIERAVQDLVYLDKCPPYETGQVFQDKVLAIGAGNSPLNGIGTGSLKVDLVLSGFVAPPIPRVL